MNSTKYLFFILRKKKKKQQFFNRSPKEDNTLVSKILSKM